MDNFFIDDRRMAPRLNLGKINYDAAAKVIGSPLKWEHLSLAQRMAYSAAANAVLTAYSQSEAVRALKAATALPTLTGVVDKYET